MHENGTLAYTVGGNANQYSHCAKQFLKNLKTELLYDPEIPPQVIHIQRK